MNNTSAINNFSGDVLLCGDEEHYPSVQIVIRVYLNFPVILFGLFANTINVLLFSTRVLRTSKVNWFLLALAASDILLLSCSVFMLPFPVLAEQLHSFASIQLAQYLTRWCYPLALFAQTCSVYLLVSVSAYRYLGICWPFLAQRWATSSNTKLALFISIAFSFVFNASRWGQLITVPCYSATYNRSGVRVGPSDYASSKAYSLWYSVVLYLLIMFLVPIAILVVMDFQLVRALRQSADLRRSSGPVYRKWATGSRFREDSKNDPGSQTGRRSSPGAWARKNKHRRDVKETSVNYLLLAIVSLFLVSNSLPFVNNLLEILAVYTNMFDTQRFYAFFQVSVELANLLVTINSSSHMVIYAIFNKQYRQCLLTRILCRKKLDTTIRAGLRYGSFHPHQYEMHNGSGKMPLLPLNSNGKVATNTRIGSKSSQSRRSKFSATSGTL